MTHTHTTSGKSPRGLHKWFVDAGRVFRHEWKIIRSDVGALIFFLALPLAYPLVYTLIYNPEIVTDMPIAVVDNSRTPQSRSLVQAADASPSIKIYAYCADLGEAKRLFAEKKVFGILEIPSDYARSINRGEQAIVPFYSQMSLLLRYRAFVSALTDLQITVVQDISSKRMANMGAAQSGGTALPIENHSHFLGDPKQGFASFIMPGIIILILQQSMALGICLMAGTARERRRRNGGIDPMAVTGVSASATVWGKALCYVILYIPLTIYVVRFVPEIFSLPHMGNPIDYLLFLMPMLLASAMFGQTLTSMCAERESAFLVVVFTSVAFLFLTGLTWPRYAMSEFFIWLGNLIPGTWGIEGFVRINSNGASLAESAGPYIALWILTLVYAIAATIITRRRIRHPNI